MWHTRFTHIHTHILDNVSCCSSNYDCAMRGMRAIQLVSKDEGKIELLWRREKSLLRKENANQVMRTKRASNKSLMWFCHRAPNCLQVPELKLMSSLDNTRKKQHYREKGKHVVTSAQQL